ncbi:MAG: hypothetical protein U0694_09760 [Anaerolineae bacterium]
MSSVELTHLVGLLGPLSVAVLLALMGRLSKKLGSVTHAAPYYLLFYVASSLVIVSVAARLGHILLGVEPDLTLAENLVWAVLYNALPAFGITLGLVGAWRYWSWLLAERA